MDLGKVFWIITLSLAPVSEVRGSIPYVAIVSNGDSYSMLYGSLIAIVANMMVPLIAFPLLDLLDALIARPWIPVFVKRLYRYLRSLGERRALKVKKGSYIALAVFVAVPLPVTGAWTGSLVAYVLGLDRRRSILAIDAGVLAASIIVLSATLIGAELLKRLFML